MGADDGSSDVEQGDEGQDKARSYACLLSVKEDECGNAGGGRQYKISHFTLFAFACDMNTFVQHTINCLFPSLFSHHRDITPLERAQACLHCFAVKFVPTNPPIPFGATIFSHTQNSSTHICTYIYIKTASIVSNTARIRSGPFSLATPQMQGISC
eukprot:766653-Hanusia_phi.AAC.14